MNTIQGNSSSLYKDIFMKNNKFNYAMAFFSQILSGIANIILAFMYKNVMDGIAYKDTSVIIKGIIIGLIQIAMMFSAGFIERKYVNQYIMKGLSSYKNYVFSSILNKDISAYADISSGGFINAFSNDLQLIEQNYINGQLQIFFQIFSLIIAIIAMGIISFPLMLAVAFVGLVPAIISFKVGNKLVEKESQTSDKNETFIDQTKELLNGFVLIKSFKAEKQMLKMFDKRNFVLEDTKKERRQADNTMQIIGTISAVGMIIVIILFGTFLIFKDVLTIGVILSFISLTNYLAKPTETLIPMITKYKAANGLLDKVINRLDNANIKGGDKEISSFNKSICLRNLSFAYDGSEDAVKDLNIEFKKGGSYAVVGLSGSGKTTFLMLHFRIILPCSVIFQRINLMMLLRKQV